MGLWSYSRSAASTVRRSLQLAGRRPSSRLRAISPIRLSRCGGGGFGCVGHQPGRFGVGESVGGQTLPGRELEGEADDRSRGGDRLLARLERFGQRVGELVELAI